jgi:hypothetical protein
MKNNLKAFLKDVQLVLDSGGLVRFHWVNGRTELVVPTGQVLVLLDGRTYQGFLHNKKLQTTLTRTETGSMETNNLVIEWEKTIQKGNSKMKSAILAVAVLFAVLPSNAGAQNVQSLNDAGTINQASDWGNNSANSLVKNVKSVYKPEGPHPYSHGPVQPAERGSTNDSPWSGPNLIVTIEEAQRLANLQALSLANNRVSIAEAARKAQEEAAKAKAANPSKTEVIAVQDANGNLVYVRKARKP